MNPSIQKFNSMGSTFSVFGKVVEKALSEPDKEIANSLVCQIADLLIKEVQDIKESFGCNAKKPGLPMQNSPLN